MWMGPQESIIYIYETQRFHLDLHLIGQRRKKNISVDLVFAKPIRMWFTISSKSFISGSAVKIRGRILKQWSLRQIFSSFHASDGAQMIALWIDDPSLCRISVTAGLIAVKYYKDIHGCQRVNPTDVDDPLISHLIQPASLCVEVKSKIQQQLFSLMISRWSDQSVPSAFSKFKYLSFSKLRQG